MSDNTFDIPEEFLNKDEKIYKNETLVSPKLVEGVFKTNINLDDHDHGYMSVQSMVTEEAFKAFKEVDSADKLKMKQKIGELIDTTELLISRNKTLTVKIDSLERANERLLWGLCGLTVIVLILILRLFVI